MSSLEAAMPKQSRRPKNAVGRGAQRNFTLSLDSARFLETEKRKRGRESASAVLEEIIHECRCRQDTSKIDAAISAYYDSLTDEDREENRSWGEFAETQFPRD